MPVVAGNVQKLFGCRFDRRDDIRMAVAGRAHGDAGGEIDEAVAIDVPDFRALAMAHDEGIVARIGR